ncbi:MAG: hypothetical protein OHK0046_22550 [Anaerolineae bacterium]
MGRDVTPEVEFIIELYRQMHGREPDSLLDLACGPGYHARRFAQCGKRAVGLDFNPAMIDMAQEKAAADGVAVEWLVGDMRSVELAQPVDMAVNVFDGIDCLTSNDDLITHLQSIAANLTPGGLYLIDVTNPIETSISHYAPFRYHAERDGIDVDVQWGVNDPYVDPLTHVAHTRMRMTINDHGEHIVIEDEADERVLTAQEIILLARLSGGLHPVCWYGAYDLNQPFNRESPRMIAVLQKMG